MRVIVLFSVVLLLPTVSAQEGKTKDQQPESRIPTTLAEAHAELERVLSPEVLAKIDAMPSETELWKHHFGLGTSIRNSWGLWQGGPLAEHMKQLGFHHPDIMSGVILETFWCKRHGRDFRLKERAVNAKRSRQMQRSLEKERQHRLEEGKAAIREMMMGLRFEKRDVPVVRIPSGEGPNVRFMGPFRDGVFLTALRNWPPRKGPIVSDGDYFDSASGRIRPRPDMDDEVWRGLYWGGNGEPRGTRLGDNFYTLGFYLDLKDRKVHRIRVEEVDEVSTVVVAGERAWFAGLTDGDPILVGVGGQDRVTVPLPQADEIPDLGLDGQCLLAVYARRVYRLTDRQWTLIHSGDILLPRSGLPPQRHGNMVLLRDEEMPGGGKRLWWLTVGETPRLRLLARDMGLFEPIIRRSPNSVEEHPTGPPGWGMMSSCCVTSSGDLWACVGCGSFLLRRSQDGTYAVAVANGSVQFAGHLSVFKAARDRAVPISAVTTLPDDTLLLAGCAGLYHLKGDELVQDLAFTSGELADDSDGAPRPLKWRPEGVLPLGDQSYLISSGSGHGVYLIRSNDKSRWNCFAFDEGDPVEW